ncbi:MAG: nickel-type superoxide dismutase maturation protease [Pyrinomonadaceae bacterium]|nr:nickel-type superoxide dismutase maturation protease [Pyrinomonadaceae bacterium]
MKTATYIDIFWLLLDYYQRYRIEGNSMLPTLQNGDQVLVEKNENYQINDIVVAKHPFQKSVILIKRISEINEKGFYLIGDNASESTDSRTLGTFAKKDLLGKVICKLNN